MKNVLILSGSPRKGGNSDLLCDEFLQGAQAAGHSVEKVFVRSRKIAACNACYACRGTGACVLKDDMAEIIAKMQSADVLVMSSPVYFYSINAQMKMLIDRCLCGYLDMRSKEMYYIMTAADSPESMDCTLECFRGFAACLPGSKEKGVIRAGGVYEAGSVAATAYMQQAYEMGRNI